MGGEGQEFRRLQRNQQIFSSATDAQNTSDLSHPREKFPGQMLLPRPHLGKRDPILEGKYHKGKGKIGIARKEREMWSKTG